MNQTEVLESSVSLEFADRFRHLVGKENVKFDRDDQQADSIAIQSLLKRRHSDLESFENRNFEADDLKINLPLLVSFGDRVALVHNATSHFFKMVESNDPSNEQSISFDDLISQASAIEAKYKTNSMRLKRSWRSVDQAKLLSATVCFVLSSTHQ